MYLPENKLCKSLQVNEKVKRILSPHKERAVLSAFKGSITVEAAMVLSVFICVIYSMISIPFLINFHSSLQIDLDNAARELSIIEVGMDNSGGLLDVYSISRILSSNTGRIAGTCGILGGRCGINLTDSDFDSESGIKTIKAVYLWKSPQKLFAFEQKACYIPWIGKSLIDEKKQKNGTKKVYITENGMVYHLYKNCTYLTREIKKVNFYDIKNYRNLGGGKYYPCEKCVSEKCEGCEVYITVYGTRYHTNKDCNVLKRYIKEVDIDQVKNKRKCSKCGGG